MKWWDGQQTLPLRDAVLGMEGREGDLPDHVIEIDHLYTDTAPVFFGHYWLKGEPHSPRPMRNALISLLPKAAISRPIGGRVKRN